ncbi:unnamed protein product [Blepharisma stoltei]|uniref:CCR4-NOT transcription complex subunit 11 n=1 Tax=Blepharisma stoltei TaxID=1481888 RepID=A0AAU9ILZ0_9CILI|nr:unnamed protein product [Blepharisma stoltei]
MDSQILKEKTLDAAFQTFLKIVPKTTTFQAAYELLAWLQDDSLTVHERTIAIYILLEISKQSENAFLSTIAELTDLSPYPWEKLLLQDWLRSREVGRMAPSDVVKLTGEAKELDHIKRSRAVRPLVNGGSKDKSNSVLGRYEPEFLRPIPEFVEISSSETKWLSPMTVPEILWDEHESESSIYENIRDLLRISLQSKLSPEQTSTVIAALEQEPKLVLKSGLSHKNLSDLVNKNPAIAIEMIVRIANSSKVQDYFGELVQMPLSLNSLEVVNKLAMIIELPLEFLHLFISNCMNSCKMIRDKYTQTRLVRLLCVFINSLLKNKLLGAQDLLVEIQHFSQEFTSMKEAQALYKSLRSMNNNE